MKNGIIISLVLVLFIGAMTFFLFWGFPDDPTSATAPNTLVAYELPNDLPPVFTPSSSSSDATALYEQALDLFERNEQELLDEDPPERTIKQLAQLLTQAAEAEQVQFGWLDQRVPLEINALPDYGPALAGTIELVFYRAQDLYEAGDETAAAKLLQAVWALGQRCFTHNQRLVVRQQGLTAMSWAAGPMTELTEHLPLDDKAMRQWEQATRAANEHFQNKMEIVMAAKPHMGDLLNLAKNEQDPTFHVEAILRLGVMKFNPGSRSNQRVLTNTLQDAQNSDNPQIAQAAEKAQALTLEQMRTLN